MAQCVCPWSCVSARTRACVCQRNCTHANACGIVCSRVCKCARVCASIRTIVYSTQCSMMGTRARSMNHLACGNKDTEGHRTNEETTTSMHVTPWSQCQTSSQLFNVCPLAWRDGQSEQCSPHAYARGCALLLIWTSAFIGICVYAYPFVCLTFCCHGYLILNSDRMV